MTALRHLLASRSGASAVEFALVVPALTIALLMIVDGGRYMWNVNRLEKAAHFGVRYAIVTDPVATEIISHDFVDNAGSPAIYQGDTIPASAMRTMTCNSTSCTCASGTQGVCLSGTYNSAAFTNIVNRVKIFAPKVEAGNVTVTYAGSGLGYAGDPGGADIAPLITVTIGEPSRVLWTPISALMLLNAGYPTIRSSLTAEDLAGSQSN